LLVQPAPIRLLLSLPLFLVSPFQLGIPALLFRQAPLLIIILAALIVETPLLLFLARLFILLSLFGPLLVLVIPPALILGLIVVLALLIPALAPVRTVAAALPIYLCPTAKD